MISVFYTWINNVGSNLKIFILTFFVLFYLVPSCAGDKERNNIFVKNSNNCFILQKNVNITRKKVIWKKWNNKYNNNNFVLKAQEKVTSENPPNNDIPNKEQYVEEKENYSTDSAKNNKKEMLLFPEVKEKEEEEENKRKEEKNTNISDEQFSHFNEINKNIVQFLANKGITYMTKIQSQCFKHIFEGRDMIARSETGTGKTLAFALPLVEKLNRIKNENINAKVNEKKNLNNNQEDASLEFLESKNEDNQYEEKRNNHQHPLMLVLEPTRELSKQVENTFKEISQFYNFDILSVYGGTSYTYQENKLKKGIDILTGTPGRIIDHIEKGNLNLKEIKFLILDEADEMLNLGFTHDIERILKHINLKNAQVLLFSATTPQWVKDLSSKYLKNPIIIDVIDSFNKTSKTINHIAIKTPYDIKQKALLLEDLILVKSSEGQTIIFTRTKLEADILCSECSFKSLTFAVLHGNIAQSTREHTMQRFRQNMFQILIATDIAARGLDISNVDLVIQLYPPNYSSIYIHRSGRTGRANKKGTSIVLFSDEDQQELIKIEKNCGIKFQIEMLPTNDTVFQCSSTLAAKKIDKVNTQVLSFFSKTAKDLIKRANKIGMSQEELISRCLALISKKEQIKKRSLLNGLSDTVTLCFVNKLRNWKNENDIVYWIRRISNELNINTFNQILTIKMDTQDRKLCFFDLHENIGQLLVQSFNHMSKEEHRKQLHLFIPNKLPDNLESAQKEERQKYSFIRRNYNYRKPYRSSNTRKY